MDKTKVLIAVIIGVVVIVAAVAIYGATAKEKSESSTGPTSTQTGGVGESIISVACGIFGIKC